MLTWTCQNCMHKKMTFNFTAYIFCFPAHPASHQSTNMVSITYLSTCTHKQWWLTFFLMGFSGLGSSESGIIIKQNNYQKLSEPAIMLTNPFSQVHPVFRMLLPEFPLCHLSMSLMQICYTMTVYMSYNAYNCDWWTRLVILLWLLIQRIEWLNQLTIVHDTRFNTFAGGGAEAPSLSFYIWNENHTFYTEDRCDTL